MKFFHSLLLLAVIIGLKSILVEDLNNPQNYPATAGTGVFVDPEIAPSDTPKCQDQEVISYKKKYYCKISQTEVLRFHHNPYQ